jgi:hypothetical protein
MVVLIRQRMLISDGSIKEELIRLVITQKVIVKEGKVSLVSDAGWRVFEISNCTGA